MTSPASQGLDPSSPPTRKMDEKRNWVYRRSNDADRLRKEDVRTALQFYKELETAVGLSTGDGGFKQQPSGKGYDSVDKDSGIAMSPATEVTDRAATDPARSRLNLPSIAPIPNPLKLKRGAKHSALVPLKDINQLKDCEFADEFHAALGPELDVVREQIRNVLQEGLVIFPLELIARLYLRYGRRLPQLYEGYSSAKLLAWLKLISALDLNNLIVLS